MSPSDSLFIYFTSAGYGVSGADQILASHRVREALTEDEQAQLRSLGPMYLRGKSEVTEVFRVDWRIDRDADATVMGVSMFKTGGQTLLELVSGSQTLHLAPRQERLTLGRATTATVPFNDSRVSRLHATIEWRGGQFILGDASSFGTWVYMGNQSEPVILRRTECYLVGQGHISLGCDHKADNAPMVQFTVKS